MHVAPRDQVQGHGTVKSVGSDHFELVKGDGSGLHVMFRQCTFTPSHVKDVLLGTKTQPEEIELRKLKKTAVEEGMLLTEVRGMSAAGLRLEISKRRRQGVTGVSSLESPGTTTAGDGAAEAEATAEATDTASPHVWRPHWCDKEKLAAEYQRQIAEATDKRSRKALNKKGEAHRKELVEAQRAIAAAALPPMMASFMRLHEDLKPLLTALEAKCQTMRDDVAALPTVEERSERVRVFYDGTADTLYSNFSAHRLAIGPLGFMKGEQLFHVVKAMLCQDLEAGCTMCVTTGGPALRGLGREVRGYFERGGEWDNLDSGLVTLVNITIKLAAIELVHVPHELTSVEQRQAAMELHDALRADGEARLYIAEGAKDDARCGIGVHATDAQLLEKMGSWGRNALGHACMAVAAYCAAAGPGAAGGGAP